MRNTISELIGKVYLCLTKHNSMKTCDRMELQLHAFLTSALSGGEWSASRSGIFVSTRCLHIPLLCRTSPQFPCVTRSCYWLMQADVDLSRGSFRKKQFIMKAVV